MTSSRRRRGRGRGEEEDDGGGRFEASRLQNRDVDDVVGMRFSVEDRRRRPNGEKDEEEGKKCLDAGYEGERTDDSAEMVQIVSIEGMAGRRRRRKRRRTRNLRSDLERRNASFHWRKIEAL